MICTKKSAGNLFSMVLTLALLCLMTTMMIPGVMGAPLLPPVITLTSSDNPSVYSHPVIFTATVSGSGGAADENVTFKDNGVAWFGSSYVSLNGTSAANITKSDLTVGSHNITAWYSGNSTRLANMSFINPQTVNTAGFNPASNVDLGLAGNYAVLSNTGITKDGAAGTLITGNIGSSLDAADGGITGFSLTGDGTNGYKKSIYVTGRVYTIKYAVPTPTLVGTAVDNMNTAYNTINLVVPPDATNLYAGVLGGQNLTPGVYKFTSDAVLIPVSTVLTLDAQGNESAVWIFQVEKDLTMEDNSRMLLINGAKPENIYWHIGGPTGVTLNVGAHAEGNILTAKAINMITGASLNGRALAQTEVTLQSNPITAPAGGAVASNSMVGVFRSSNHQFYLDTSGNGHWSAGDYLYNFGNTGDLPVAGDWNNDGTTEIGVFRSSTHMFYLDKSGNGAWGSGDVSYSFGATGDLPVAGDWNNDGTTEIGVFRDSTHTFYLDKTGNGAWGIGDSRNKFGATGDLPVAGDWNSDGTTEIGIFRPSSQRFYLDTNGNGVWGAGDAWNIFGATGDLPVAGDWNSDGTTEIGIFRPSTHLFYLDYDGNGTWNGAATDRLYDFGTTGDKPVAGKW